MALSSRYISAIYASLGSAGLKEAKEQMVLQFTNGRTESVRAMTTVEARALIEALKSKSKTPSGVAAMKKKIYAICFAMGWTLAASRKKLDFNRIDNFCRKQGHAKKPFGKYSQKELVTLVSQFEKLEATHLNKQ